ncbi:MAG: hypothetical protein IPJ40_08895 [Saprospirales bacterium]|nr:hypothetical protein [Saprospirales bacterium]
MRNFFFWIALLLVSGGVHAQERLLFSHSCNYTGEINPVEDLYGFASDTEADDAMHRIMRYTGLPANFTIKAANVPNAAAVIYEEKRFILYNQYFMLRIKDQTKTDWAALSILAHEIGHHLSGHTLDSQGSRPDKELEADQFSGFILYKMGASLEEARIAMETLAVETGTSTHPPKSARLAAVTNGWMEAKQQNEDIKPISPSLTASTTPTTPTMVPRSPTADPQKATASFKRIWVEKEVEEQGEKGVRIHAHFNVANLFGQDCRAVAWFYDGTTGEPLEDFNGAYSTSTGDVSVGVDFVPNYISADFTDVPFFIPYEELHQEEGVHLIKFQVGLFHQLPAGQMQQIGAVSAFYTFEYELAPPAPSALFRKMWVDFDVYEGIQKGMRIHLQFNLKNLKGHPCRAVVGFYGDSGLPLLDYNGLYNTIDGKVSVRTDFSPQYDSSDFHDFILFMPYDELHLSPGNHSLVLDANLFFQQDNSYVELGDGFEKFRFVFSK